jgi:fibronectin type 3 domain-containing protein
MFKKFFKAGVTLVLVCSLLPTSVYAETVNSVGSSLQSSTESTEQQATTTAASTTEKSTEVKSTEATTEAKSTEAKTSEAKTAETKSTEVQSSEAQSSETSTTVQNAEKTTEKSSETISTQAAPTKKVETTENVGNTESTQIQFQNPVTESVKATDTTYLNTAVSQRADSDGDADLPAFLKPGEGATGISGNQTLNPSSATVNDVLSIMKPIICTNEVGSTWNTNGYGRITPNDNGFGISAGILQWNATNALRLLQTIIAVPGSNAQQILGPDLYNIITTASSWDGTKDATRFIPNDDLNQIKEISNLLSSPAGKSVQDSLATQYFSGYVDRGFNIYKITNASALCYLCDIKNQCKDSTVDGIVQKAVQLAGGKPGDVTLNEMHEAAILDSVTGKYLSRRYQTYNSIADAASARGWSFYNTGAYRIPTPTPSSYVNGSTNSDAIKWLQWALNSTIQSGLTIDGGYGPLTTAAVKDFQSKNGLTSDGFAGQQTIIKLVQVLDGMNLLTFHSNSISDVVPTVSNVKVTASGVKVSWSEVTNATTYNIYRKVGGKYTKVGTVPSGTTSFTDTTAASGTTYRYRIKAFNDNSSSAYSTSVSIYYLQAPALKKVTVKTNALRVSWSKVNGASGYYIYRKQGSGSYNRIATITNGTSGSYTDTTVKNNKTYTYTVKSYNNTTKSPYISAGVSGTFLKAPTLQKASATVKGVKVSWSKTSGATGYYVYRKTKKGNYTLVGTVANGSKTNYTDTTASNKTTYTYTVIAYNNSTASAYDSKGVTIFFFKAPVLKSANLTTSGIKVSWEKVSGASGYAVYRKAGSGAYQKIKDITSGSTLSFTDKTVSNKNSYTYTVRAVKGNASSSYNKGISQTFLAATKKQVKSSQYFFNGPGVKFSTVGMLTKGAKVLVVDGYTKKANGYKWSKIFTKNTFYYLDSKYLKKL